MDIRGCDVAIVGGGLGGLCAAALMARRGLDVVVLERASAPGGRARTREHAGYLFNEGAHALYVGGAAARVLARLGVRWSGRRPPAAGLALSSGRLHRLPTTAGALFATDLLGWIDKLHGARVMATLGSRDTRALDSVPWSAWAERHVPSAAMRAVLEAFVRVSTYAHAPSLASAGATLDQLRLAQQPGVHYVDGGWGALVEGVAGAALSAGARLELGARATRVEREGDAWLVSSGPDRLRCAALILATGPAAARGLVAAPSLVAWADAAVPARVACLDVALDRLPDPRATFALGIDRPLYLSVHSRTARLAPDGGALVSTMKYLAPGEPGDPGADAAELEALLDALQPGWRARLVERSFLPSMVATHAIPTARGGGARGRPGPRVTDAPLLWAVGDWTGPEGALLDASLASAEAAADEVSALAAARAA